MLQTHLPVSVFLHHIQGALLLRSLNLQNTETIPITQNSATDVIVLRYAVLCDFSNFNSL